MRLIPRLRTRLLASEHGFSMIIVMGVMAASTLFVAAAFAAANGDLPLTRDSQDRKQSYAAAEAGINLYQYHLNQDPDYWTKCTNVPAPNASENQPVNQAWNGAGTDPRRWRNVAGHPDAVHDRAAAGQRQHAVHRGQPRPRWSTRPTGSFRIRATGRPRAEQQAQAQHHRHLPPPLVPGLPLLHRLRDDRPGQLLERADQSWAQTNCGDKYRVAARHAAAQEIQFADATRSRARSTPTTTSSTCGTPEFGAHQRGLDRVQRPGAGLGQLGGSCCAGTPVFKGPVRAGVKTLTMPPTNATLATLATAGGALYTGTTAIRFNSRRHT